MKTAVLVAVGFSSVAFVSSTARADTIFDVEHARANYRSGITSEYDRELLRRWGRPSGYYPQYGEPRPRRIYFGRRYWRDR
jgi:hypothetical protein